MNSVLSCDEGKFFKYNRCPNCYFESKRIPYQFPDDNVESAKQSERQEQKKKKKRNRRNDKRRKSAKQK